MNLSELTSEVYIATNRPDQVDKTASAIKSATLFSHHSDFYRKDIFETGVTFLTSEFQQSLDTDIFTRFRKLKYIRKYDNVAAAPGAFLTPLDPEEMLDSYGIQKEDIVYEGGQTLNLRSSTAEQFYLVGIYQSPDVTTLNYNSWIADNYPYLIIYKAASIVLNQIGNKEGAQYNQGLAGEQFQEFTISALAVTGA